MIVALAGGVGGAKLALGLSRILSPDRLRVFVNTGDDFVHLGLHVSPDLDTVMYTLAGIENPQTGWGVAGETWSFMDAMARLGGETWFRLGDRDLAVHVERTRRLAQGEPLSAITSDLCRRLKVFHPILPMTDERVATMVVAADARMPFQDYFVKRRCEPVVTDIIYIGAETAQPLPELLAALTSPALEGVIVCPSNPYLSVGPMLAMPALRHALQERTKPVIAVSPIIGGQALKGPAAKIMTELGREASCVGVADYYRGLIDCLLIDHRDAHDVPSIRARSIEPLASDIIMRDLDDRCRLARVCCDRLNQ
jgi:LPPG:FO 2-phospho-L-lactate transferase